MHKQPETCLRAVRHNLNQEGFAFCDQLVAHLGGSKHWDPAVVQATPVVACGVRSRAGSKGGLGMRVVDDGSGAGSTPLLTPRCSHPVYNCR